MSTTTWGRGRLQFKAEQMWREELHPRDRKGRFIEIGSRISVMGGATGTVTGSPGKDLVTFTRDGDNAPFTVHRNRVTVLSRPNGDAPVSKRQDGLAEVPQVDAPDAPEEHSVPAADVPAGVAPDAKPVHTGGGDGESGPVPSQEDWDMGMGLFDDGADIAIPPAEDLARVPEEANMAVEDATKAANGEGDEPQPENGHIQQQQTVYEFNASRLDEAIAIIDKANKRAERAGVPDRIGYSIERFEIEQPYRHPDGTVDLGAPKVKVERARLTLDRPEVKHDGWRFVATLDWDPEAGLITRVISGHELTARPEAKHCDVCNSKRDRKDTYIVQRVDDPSVQQQVGKNCLVQFLGIQPKGLWMLDWDGLAEFEKSTDDYEGDGGVGGRGEQRPPTDEVLRYTIAIARANGFVSRAAADERRMATVDLVEEAMFGRPRTREAEQWQEQMRAEAAGVDQEDITALRDFARTIDGDGEYPTNLRAVSTADSVSTRNMGLLVSAFGAKQRADGVRAEREARKASQHIGMVGDKIKDQPARVTSVRYIDGTYGTTTLITMVTPEGNVLKWFASGSHDWNTDDEILVSGTIKKHDQYNDVPETVLTRSKIRLSPEGERKAAEKDAAREAALKAEEEAAQQARDAAAKAARVAVPEGYTAADAEAQSHLRVAMAVRIPDGKTDKYIDAYTVSDPFDDNGVRKILVGTDTEYVALPVDQVAALGPADEATTNAAINRATSYMKYHLGQPGFEVLPGTFEARDGIEPGAVVRIRQGGYSGLNGYITATVTAVDGNIATVREADGTERRMSLMDILAVKRGQ